MRKHSRACAAEASPGKHLVCGSGGTKAYLSGAGAILAFDLAGVDNWRTIGGVSGGSIPSLLLAAGVDPAMIVTNAIDIDFSDLLVQTDSFSNVLKTRLRPRLHKEKRLRDGVVDSHRLGRLLERFVPEWPKSYWTIAMAGDAMLLFTADGVFEYRGGRKRQISSTPAPVGLAIRASCAVPGVIESVRFAGRELFDGALGPYGGCPTRMVKRHFGATARDIAAVDLVKSASSRQDRFLMLLGRAISGTLKYRPRHNQEPPVEAGLLVQPEVNGFPSLEFELTREQKQEAVLAGFRAAVKSLEQAGMLKGKKLEQSRLASESFAELERLCLSSVPRQRRSGESFWQRLVRKVLRRR